MLWKGLFLKLSEDHLLAKWEDKEKGKEEFPERNSINSLTIFSTSSASTNPLTYPFLGIILSPTPISSVTILAFKCCSAMPK
uniref:Uncharacterized protein n=1 Tax=Solanum lycopersicum TaxID=4081 RepID=A0A3Q7FR79_SOLLC